MSRPIRDATPMIIDAVIMFTPEEPCSQSKTAEAANRGLDLA